MPLRAPSLVLAAALLCAAATATTAPAGKPGPLPRGFADANTAFALELYGRLRARPGNLFFSPASISTALALTFAGARGETAAQMKRTLRFALAPKALHAAFASLLARLESPGAAGPELGVANRLWVQTGAPLLPDFQKIARLSYGAEAEVVDFATALEAARARVNQAVEAATRGRITEILPAGAVDPQVKLVLTSAIYFKGRWERPFGKDATRELPFTVKPGVTRTVPMMHQALATRLGETDDLQVLELPYRAAARARALAMVVILPRRPDGLAALEARLSPAALTAALRTLRPTKKVEVLLPRVTSRSALALDEALAAMGMPLAFDRERADFSGLSKRDELHVGMVLHRAFVDVNEEGTEAAAATAVLMRPKNGHRVPVFRADHPFLFLIRDVQTGSVLFMGRIVDPTPAAPSRG